jgi:hypothetical protein
MMPPPIFSMYERRCRLGGHIRLGTKEAPRDAILRVGRQTGVVGGGAGGGGAAGSLPPEHSLHELFAQFGIDSSQLAADPITQRIFM